MKLYSQKQMCEDIASRWNEYYTMYYEDYPNLKTIYDALIKLGKDGTPDSIAKAIGNDSWTRITCHECNREVAKAVELGQEPDYESATATICEDCLLKALALVQIG